MSFDLQKDLSRRVVCMWASDSEDRAEGNFVSTRWQLTATHSGDFKGLASTGKEIGWGGVHTDHIDGDKIVESWVDWD